MSQELIWFVLQLASHGCSSALDVGSGPGKYRPPFPEWHTIDAYELAPSRYHRIGDLRTILPTIEARSYDLVYALDVIEHLVTDDGVKMLVEMERIARRRVLIFTPNGFMKQDGVNQWQTHRSGWVDRQFKSMGYYTAICDFNYGVGKGIESENALLAAKEIIV